MEEKKSLLITVGASVAIAAGFGALLYMQSGDIDTKRQNSERISGEIAQARALIAATPEVERKVILMRETDEVISSLLPTNDDVLEFARALSSFGKNAGVNITQFRQKSNSTANSKQKEDFRKVGYSINFDADAFQMLALLDRVESHERFMQVPSFKLTAAPSVDPGDMSEAPLHKVAMEIETFVYEPQRGTEPVNIENYERKAELLAGEVAQRRRELEIPSYDFNGVRNRRDPWVDPRVPILDPNVGNPIPIPEQLQLVEELEKLGDRASELWQDWNGAPNLIAEMKARRDLEEHLSELTLECDTLESDRVFTYFPAQRRFEGVREILADIRGKIEEEDVRLPKVEVLRGTIETIYAHIERRDFESAWDAYSNIEGRLPLALRDPLRRPLAQKVEELGLMIQTVLEFEQLDIEVDGFVSLGPDNSVVLIGGETFGPRQFVGPDLLIDRIDADRVVFIFKGVRLELPIESGTGTPEPR